MSLLNAIKETAEIRTLFGKKELIIIEKQLRGIPLKPSEKTRLSRDIRKKFIAIKELAAFKDEFFLKHGEETKGLIERTKSSILDSEYFPKIKKIYLFGSTAEKKHLFRSDIDIAVEFTKITLEEATRFRIKTHVPDKIDLQVYNILPDKIKKQIDKHGKTIYARN